jgi:hypothetical protein
VNLEGAHRVLVEGRDEDHAPGDLGSESLEDPEAVTGGHLDVQEEKVGAKTPDQVHGLFPRRGFGDDLHGGLVPQERNDRTASGRLVVGDHGPETPGRVSHRPRPP